MATEQIGDYPQKMIEFGLHWQSVNTSLGGTPETAFKLAGGYDQAQFMTDRDAIVAKLTEIEGLKNELDFARADRDSLRGDLRQRLILFRSSVKALLASTPELYPSNGGEPVPTDPLPGPAFGGE